MFCSKWHRCEKANCWQESDCAVACRYLSLFLQKWNYSWRIESGRLGTNNIQHSVQWYRPTRATNSIGSGVPYSLYTVYLNRVAAPIRLSKNTIISQIACLCHAWSIHFQNQKGTVWWRSYMVWLHIYRVTQPATTFRSVWPLLSLIQSESDWRQDRRCKQYRK